MTNTLRLGIDIGSTTVKTVVYDKQNDKILFQKYQRHHAEQRKTAGKLLEEVMNLYPQEEFRIGVCGSGGKIVADLIGAHYIQEVVANSSAIRAKYPHARTAIELGGQDAKIIFFYCDEKFSYIHSDIEKAFLSIMVDKLEGDRQLFFTTHDLEILDMDFPKHSFNFLRKEVYDNKCYISFINASKYIKKNSDSLKIAVLNDLFSSAPMVDKILDLSNI